MHLFENLKLCSRLFTLHGNTAFQSGKTLPTAFPTTCICTSVKSYIHDMVHVRHFALEYLKRLEKAAAKLQWNGKAMKSANRDRSPSDTKRIRRWISSRICSFRLGIIKHDKVSYCIALLSYIVHRCTLAPLFNQWGSYHTHSHPRVWGPRALRQSRTTRDNLLLLG